MKSLLLALLFTLLLSTAFSQPASITDSLKQQLAISPADTNRVKLLVSLSQYYHRANTDTSMSFAKEGLQLAERLQFATGKADCLYWIGMLLELQGLYAEALDHFQKLLFISEGIEDNTFLRSRAFRAIGDLYFDQGGYKKALGNLAIAKGLQETIQYRLTGVSTYRSLGRVYLALNKLDSTLFYFNKSYRKIMDINIPSSRVALDDILKDLGQLHYKIGNVTMAMQFFRSSIPYSMIDKDYITLNETCIGIARLFLKSGQTDSSIFYCKKGVEVALQRKFLKGVLEATRLLSEIYEGINEHEALGYHKNAAVINDSLFNSEKIKQLQNLEFVELQRKQKEAETDRIYTEFLIIIPLKASAVA